jgi:hypothetical protein
MASSGAKWQMMYGGNEDKLEAGKVGSIRG